MSRITVITNWMFIMSTALEFSFNNMSIVKTRSRTALRGCLYEEGHLTQVGRLT